MDKILWSWVWIAACLLCYSIGVDEGCKRDHYTMADKPSLFLLWPIAAVAIITGWKPSNKDICQ